MSDAGSNLAPEVVREFIDEYDEHQKELDDCRAACKAPAKRIRQLRKRIEDSGLGLRVFDRMREDMDLPATEREDDLRQYHQVMQYIGKPVKYQGDFVFDEPAGDIDPAMTTERARERIADHGYTAGKTGKSNDVNPWEQGRAAAVHWQENYAKGHAEFMAAQEAIAASMAPEAPRRRGRPPGSGKKSATGTGAKKGKGAQSSGTTAPPDPGYDKDAETAERQADATLQ